MKSFGIGRRGFVGLVAAGGLAVAASMLLLIAAVGAVVLAARRPPLDSPDVEEPSILNPPEGGV